MVTNRIKTCCAALLLAMAPTAILAASLSPKTAAHGTASSASTDHWPAHAVAAEAVTAGSVLTESGWVADRCPAGECYADAGLSEWVYSSVTTDRSRLASLTAAVATAWTSDHCPAADCYADAGLSEWMYREPTADRVRSVAVSRF